MKTLPTRLALPRPQATALTLAVLAVLATPASEVLAQQEAANTRIEVTGSIIRRTVSDEAALPVTSIKSIEMEATKGYM